MSAAFAPQPNLAEVFARVRAVTSELIAGLHPEDLQLQSMTEASPGKWHLAHTSWFFEEFVLARDPSYRPFDPAYRYLFNSYYESVGDRHPRPRRGLLSRPLLSEVLAYRRHVDEAMARRIEEGLTPELAAVVELGCHHEQQHQELLLTDLLHAFSFNPCAPAYAPAPEDPPPSDARALPLTWRAFGEGIFEIGAPPEGFAFDNERPRHRVFVEPFELSNRLVTNGEYLAFIRDGGYRRFELWLSEGFDAVKAGGWSAPLYWRERDGAWFEFGLHGLRPLRLDAPVSCLSYFEADAYARWAGARLPTEQEWEVASAHATGEPNLLDGRRFEALPARADGLTQMFGDLWEWTSSSYAPYPGYRPLAGALGEYNGKFMCNQYVLRGGSFATAASHLRPSYRNFFPTSARWQFTGIRLARGGPSERS
ncbi:MAG: ergothioneine biosynthesis protein EgtB [Myxococcaceae bacterium]|nr:ergothioneine biosynthesis protein EgtB [Myxococcaceae bacterium]